MHFASLEMGKMLDLSKTFEIGRNLHVSFVIFGHPRPKRNSPSPFGPFLLNSHYVIILKILLNAKKTVNKIDYSRLDFG